jgi:hypothetical protein
MASLTGHFNFIMRKLLKALNAGPQFQWCVYLKIVLGACKNGCNRNSHNR